MSRLRDESKAQRDDIVSWFRSMPGLITSGIILGGFAVWVVVQFILDAISQAAG